MKAIVVLGAAVWADGPSPTLTRRCLHAAKLWHAGGFDAIIVCGGLGQVPPSEATAMARILHDAGVSEDVVHLEDQSTTTFENLTFAREILSELRCTKIMIVTDGYHRPRARLVARMLGLSVTTNSPSLRGTHMPTQLKQYLREALALPVYAIRLGVTRLRRPL
jgi:uncharacterized SAM-binding protein YcdF (DUF218 family)